MKSIKAVITDLDGVIRFFPKDRDLEIESKYSLPAGALTKCAFAHEDLNLAITGKILDKEWRSNIANRLSEQFKLDNADQIVEEWSEFLGEIDNFAISLFEEVRKNIPVLLMTNATDRLENDLRKLEVLSKFDLIINSSKVGYAKPDERIFNYALDYLSLSPEEVIFIDDSSSIVEKALQLGFKAYKHTINKDFDTSLASYIKKKKQ